jgi:hypothetical protein
LTAGGNIEISSSGTCDINELSWGVPLTGLKDGWNELDLKLSQSAITDGRTDLSAVNFFRIYHHGIKNDVTVKLDDIYLYEE